jgi:hypothetical protein
MPEDQGMLDTQGNAIRLTPPGGHAIMTLSPEGDRDVTISQ